MRSSRRYLSSWRTKNFHTAYRTFPVCRNVSQVWLMFTNPALEYAYLYLVRSVHSLTVTHFSRFNIIQLRSGDYFQASAVHKKPSSKAYSRFRNIFDTSTSLPSTFSSLPSSALSPKRLSRWATGYRSPFLPPALSIVSLIFSFSSWESSIVAAPAFS